MKPNINFEKLKNYVMENSSYRLYTEKNTFELHFIPNAPEAESHFPDGESVEHVMYGYIEGEAAYFTKFVTTSAFGNTEINIIDDDPVMEWLKYI
jgi:hypothetical protein